MHILNEVRSNVEGVVRSEEVERCVREVMGGELCKEFRMKALEWSDKAKKSMSEGEPQMPASQISYRVLLM
jgi:hypothetical protein